MGIVFFAYVLHMKYQPFLDRLDLESPGDSVGHVRRDGAVLNYVFKYNTLESVYLITSMIVLLCGMVFQSNFLPDSSAGYIFLTYMVR